MVVFENVLHKTQGAIRLKILQSSRPTLLQNYSDDQQLQLEPSKLEHISVIFTRGIGIRRILQLLRHGRGWRCTGTVDRGGCRIGIEALHVECIVLHIDHLPIDGEFALPHLHCLMAVWAGIIWILQIHRPSLLPVRVDVRGVVDLGGTVEGGVVIGAVLVNAHRSAQGHV